MGKHQKALTLIELVVVITVLAIMLSLAFFSLTSYNKTSRDSVRLTNLNNISKTLELYYISTGVYPNPSDSSTLTYSGAHVWYQGTVSESVLMDLKRLMNIPLDPLTNNPYAYSISRAKNKYQIATALEGGFANMNVVNSSHADGKVQGSAFIKGTYQGIITNTQTGATTYILALPSIMASDLSNTDLVELISNKSLVYRGKRNLPASYSGSQFKVAGGFDFTPNNLLVYSGVFAELQDDRRKRLAFIKKVQDSYRNTIISEETGLIPITKINLFDTLQADTLAISLVGGSAVPRASNPSIVFKNISGSDYTCISCN